MRIILAGIFIVLSASVLSQRVIEHPVITVSTHPSLQIERITITDTETRVEMQITNELEEGGWFCADANISLITYAGESYQLQRSQNIPVCPESHHFKKVGESLHFTLYFPPIRETYKIGIIENCADNCFNLQGIILDQQLNSDIHNYEKALMLFEQNKLVEAKALFEGIISNKNQYDVRIYGLSYFYLISIAELEQNLTRKNELITALRNSSLPDKNMVLKKLGL